MEAPFGALLCLVQLTGRISQMRTMPMVCDISSRLYLKERSTSLRYITWMSCVFLPIPFGFPLLLFP